MKFIYSTFIIIVLVIILVVFRFVNKILLKKCTCKVSLSDKVIIVTGGNTGIGYYTALNLAAKGGRIILACRNENKGLEARDKIIKKTDNTNVIYKHLDLASLSSVRKFANDVLISEERLDILINNAGAYGPGDKYTEDGLVEALQVNYFGPFLLTLLLLKLLKKSRPSRIIFISSILHYYGYFKVDNLNKIGRSKLLSYINSKLCGVLFCLEFSKRFNGTGVVANSIHPGMIDTNISANANFFIKIVFKFCCWICCRTIDEGVQTIIHVAVSEECENVSGKFFIDFHPRFLLPTANNALVASNLWEFSEDLVGYKLNSEGTIHVSSQ